MCFFLFFSLFLFKEQSIRGQKEPNGHSIHLPSNNVKFSKMSMCVCRDVTKVCFVEV